MFRHELTEYVRTLLSGLPAALPQSISMLPALYPGLLHATPSPTENLSHRLLQLLRAAVHQVLLQPSTTSTVPASVYATASTFLPAPSPTPTSLHAPTSTPTGRWMSCALLGELRPGMLSGLLFPPNPSV